ncbi:MAG: IucA/IucC family protein [Chthoniobacteraceae bacterium]
MDHTRRWLDYEQSLNEVIDRDRAGRIQIVLRSHTVREECHPEQRGKWRQEVVWLPAGQVRVYGGVAECIRRAFRLEIPPGRAPLLLHPQMPAAHRRLRDAFGSTDLGQVWVTPTSSFRSVVASSGRRKPVVLKLSMGAVISGAHRELREREVACGMIISRILETIPVSERRESGLDWFPETAGIVETISGTGWLLRQLPRLMFESGAGQLVPAFSLISRRGEGVPILVEMIRRSGIAAEEFVVEKLLRPYVSVLGFLLFDQGIQTEGHMQNILLELDANQVLTGRVVLRDLSDMSVSIALRIARQKPLPAFERTFFPAEVPFPLASVAADHRANAGRARLLRGHDTVVRWGLRGFVWSLNTSLARFFPKYRATVVERAYLALWQEQAVRWLGVKPIFRRMPRDFAIDDAMADNLRHIDWTPLGATGGASLAREAEPLLIGGLTRRRRGADYERIECPWGDLYLDAGRPAFFRPIV